MLIISIIIALMSTIAVSLDVIKKIDLTSKAVMCIYLVLAPHSVMLTSHLIQNAGKTRGSGLSYGLVIFAWLLFCLYILIKINIFPHSKTQVTGHRPRILFGGRKLLLSSLYAYTSQTVIYLIWILSSRDLLKVPTPIFVIDIIITILFIALLYFNGMTRILVTSRRLNVFKKLFILFTMWIPVLNFFETLYVCSIAKSEYEHECYRVENHNIRVDSSVCQTKYPLIMIHGLGFRDFKYINYWGRIPNELIKNGAKIYYGNQAAWGSIEFNAEVIKSKIMQVISETGCEKVNLIAHSKGGLDSRYMINKLNMGRYVASLTTICTPHRGSKIIDFVYKIPEGLLHFLGNFFDKYFKKIGDQNPDFFTATRQISKEYCIEFNKEVVDDSRVYYQSYTSIMKNMFSDYILTIPYAILRISDSPNDGLVTIESSKWGDFKGVLTNKYVRGISHGDIIDLRKNDYRGFDVIEQYVEIVSELKSKGF